MVAMHIPFGPQGYVLVAQGVIFLAFLIVALALFLRKPKEEVVDESLKPLAPPPPPPELKMILDKVNALELQITKVAQAATATTAKPAATPDPKLTAELKGIGEKLTALEAELTKQVEGLRATLLGPTVTPEAAPAEGAELAEPPPKDAMEKLMGEMEVQAK